MGGERAIEPGVAAMLLRWLHHVIEVGAAGPPRLNLMLWRRADSRRMPVRIRTDCVVVEQVCRAPRGCDLGIQRENGGLRDGQDGSMDDSQVRKK